MLNKWLPGLLAVLLLYVSYGCNDSGVMSEEEDGYHIEGVLIVDPNLESNPLSKSLKIAVRFKRDSDTLSTAEIVFAGSALTFQCCREGVCSAYWLESNLTYEFANSTQQMELGDDAGFADTISVSVPDSFVISNVVPTNRQIQGSEQASLEWTGSTRAETYVMAAVLADSAYNGYGYSLYTTELTTSGTIPPDAFSLSPGPYPDTGLYNLYVYAIAGSPDTALFNALLPVPLPSQLADNVSGINLNGRFGSVVVTLLDTIRVVQQP